jgi:hypothetical protein
MLKFLFIKGKMFSIFVICILRVREKGAKVPDLRLDYCLLSVENAYFRSRFLEISEIAKLVRGLREG